MWNPYEVLEAKPSASNDEIKRRYLRQVKRYPPDRAPEQFKRIREAYELIQTQSARQAFRLFYIPKVHQDDRVACCLQPHEHKPLTQAQLSALIFPKK